MCWKQGIPLLTELDTVDDRQTINISLLKELSSSDFFRRTHVKAELKPLRTRSMPSVSVCSACSAFSLPCGNALSQR
jgi:hypothetical protein